MTEHAAMTVILEWKGFWMDQKGTSEEDKSEYLKRALGVDSNMMHDLARRFENSRLSKQADQMIGYALERQDYATKRWVEALNQIEELRGVLNLKNDEYVHQVGIWKIISRLEEQVLRLEKQVEIYKEYLGLILDGRPGCDCMDTMGLAKAGLTKAKELE